MLLGLTLLLILLGWVKLISVICWAASLSFEVPCSECPMEPSVGISNSVLYVFLYYRVTHIDIKPFLIVIHDQVK